MAIYSMLEQGIMDTVEAGLSMRSVARDRLFIERFVVPADAPPGEEVSATESLVIRLDRRKHAVRYQAGDTVLEAARRAGLSPPFSCEAGSCATCPRPSVPMPGSATSCRC